MSCLRPADTAGRSCGQQTLNPRTQILKTVFGSRLLFSQSVYLDISVNLNVLNWMQSLMYGRCHPHSPPKPLCHSATWYRPFEVYQKYIWTYIGQFGCIELDANSHVWQMPPSPLCHTQCEARPPAFTPLLFTKCLFTSNWRKIQLLFIHNPAAIKPGKYTFWTVKLVYVMCQFCVKISGHSELLILN